MQSETDQGQTGSRMWSTLYSHNVPQQQIENTSRFDFCSGTMGRTPSPSLSCPMCQMVIYSSASFNMNGICIKCNLFATMEARPTKLETLDPHHGKALSVCVCGCAHSNEARPPQKWLMVCLQSALLNLCREQCRVPMNSQCKRKENWVPFLLVHFLVQRTEFGGNCLILLYCKFLKS